MKSIRLSLMAYFLVLLALALGAVSLLVYEISAHALREKQKAHVEMINAQSKVLRQEKTSQLDESLIAHAKSLASQAQVQVITNRAYWARLQPLTILCAGLGTQSHLLTPLWLSGEFVAAVTQNSMNRAFLARFQPLMLLGSANGAQNHLLAPLWVSGDFSTSPPIDIQLDENLLHTTEDRSTDLFQINLPRGGGKWRSKSLGDRSLPFDADEFRAMALLETKFEDISIDGKNWHRILFKAPILHYSVLGIPIRPQDRPRGAASPGSPSPPAPGSFRSRRATDSPFYIQYAVDRTDFDNQLRQIDEDAARQLQESDDASRDTLSGLRRRLWWIAGSTFGAVCLGAYFLVTVGLAPLRRLTDAVSRVSETNFSLQYEGPTPPVELTPIVNRLRDSLAQLQKAFDREKQATADISHELRTPLAGLLTTVDVTLRKQRTPEEYRESLKDCRDIIVQMSQMVERLLTLTWLDARSDRIKSEPIDIEALANQCAAVVRPLAKARGLTLNVHADAETIVRADQDKLREVMSNLLHNAVEYNKPNGSIDLRVRSSTSGLDVEVRDTGIGISAENRDRIFERFFRADASRQEAGLHAGLGLAIVRGYVDLMGGTISVESEEGRGSAFRVHIPAPVA